MLQSLTLKITESKRVVSKAIVNGRPGQHSRGGGSTPRGSTKSRSPSEPLGRQSGPGAQLGGAKGRWLKSKQSDMPFDLPSRSLSGGRLNVFWQNRTRLTCEFS